MAAGSIVVDLLMKTGSFETDTQRAGKALQKFEKDAIAVGSSIGLALVGASAAIVALAKTSLDSIDAMNDLSDATGASVENISALDRVARETGEDFTTVSTTLVRFNKALTDSRDAGSDAARVLSALGLSAADLRRQDPAEALRQTAVALEAFSSEGDKARAIQLLFGKSVQEAAPFLKDLAAQTKLTATITTEAAAEAEKFNKQLFALQASATDVSRSFTTDIITSINKTIDAFRRGSAEGETFLGTLRRLQLNSIGITSRLPSEENYGNEGRGSTNRNEDYSNEGRSKRDLVIPDKPPKAPKARKPQDDFGPLLKQATEMRAIADASLLAEEKLSAAQQLAAKIAADFQRGLISLTEAQVQQIDAELKGADASQRGAELRDREKRATLEAAQAFEQQYQAMLQVRDAFLEEALASNEALAAFSKTRGEIEELSIAKIRASAAALEHKAVLREERDHLDPIARLYREQAAALRDTAKARGALNEKERALTYDPLVGQTQAVKDYLAEINKAGRDTYDLTRGALEGLEDALTTAFSGGDAKGAFKSLVDSILQEATRLYLVKPILNSIFGGQGSGGVDYAKLLSSFGSLFGGGTAAPSSTGPAYVYPGSYATGMQSVPRDGYAYLHKDETVLPKAYSPGARPGGEMKVVVNAPPGTRVDRQNERQTPDGRELEVFLSMAEERVAGNLGRGRGPVAGALKSRGVGLSGAIPRRT